PGIWGQVLTVARLALVAWALAGVVLAVLPPASAYSIEGKWPKPAWIGICAVSALAFWFLPFGLISLVGMVAVGVFFADVRPAVGGRRRWPGRGRIHCGGSRTWRPRPAPPCATSAPSRRRGSAR